MALLIRSGVGNLVGVLVALVLGAACRQVAAEPRQGGTLVIHVRPTDDRQAVTAPTAVGEQASLAAGSLHEAVQLARRLRLRKPARISIELDPGIHRILEPLQLTAADSGSEEAPLIIRGPKSGGASIRGSVRVLPAGLASRDRRFGRLHAAAHDHALLYVLPTEVRRPWRADILRDHDAPHGLSPFEVFDDEGPLHAARWPNDGWARGRHEEGVPDTVFFDTVEQQQLWRLEPDLWIGGYFKWDWAFETMPVASGASGRGIQLAKPPKFGFAPDFRAYVYHALSELDTPGEWYGDAKSSRLIAWPRSHETGSPLEISVAQNLLRLEGAAHVRIENTTFEMVRGDAIQVHGGSNLEIVDCTVRWSGGRAVAMIDAHDSRVTRSRIYGNGEGGVWLSGGDRKQLISGRLSVTDTTITDYARLGRTYRPAIKIDGVGNSAVGNFIADAPHTAIQFTGNDHLIELNEITRVNADTSDAGAIYTGRDWTAQGTVIRNNFLHDLKPARGFETKGVYLDDFASGITVEGNLFIRVEQPVFIGGGRDNRVIDNVFLSSTPGILIDGRGLTWAMDAIQDHQSVLRAAYSAVPIGSPVWTQRYPLLPSVMTDDPAQPKRNVARGNLFCDSEPYEILPEVNLALQQLDHANGGQSHWQRLSVARLRRAADVGVRLRGSLQNSALAALPLAAMDRRERLASAQRQDRFENGETQRPKYAASLRCGTAGKANSE